MSETMKFERQKLDFEIFGTKFNLQQLKKIVKFTPKELKGRSLAGIDPNKFYIWKKIGHYFSGEDHYQVMFTTYHNGLIAYKWEMNDDGVKDPIIQ